MHFFLIIYVFILFVLFTNNSLFSRLFSFKGKKLHPHLVSAIAFALVLYFTYDYIHPDHQEPMILFNQSSNNLEDKIIKQTTNHNNDEDWVIIPPKKMNIPPTPPDFETIPIQCAANYSESTACCGQPPAVIPFENTCDAEKPFCNGYVEKKQWGTCGLTEEQV